MNNEYRAGIQGPGTDHRNPFGGNARLLVWEQRPFAQTISYLNEKGVWVEIPEAHEAKDAGILLPAASIEAIAVAIQQYQGHVSHADTEARVLREWLSVERGRVDRVLSSPIITLKEPRP